MKKQFKNIGFLLLVLMIGTTIFSSCENDIWNQHYGSDSKIVGNKTLWQEISQNPELSKFAWALRVTGYDKVLSSSQMYTVWAPTNAGASEIDTLAIHLDTIAFITQLKKQFVENHISRYSYSASGDFDKRIVLLNKKITHFISSSSNLTFGINTVMQKNIISKNGILHTLDNSLKFFPNIWEYLESNRDLDSLKNYLYSFNVITFDPSASIPGELNSEGNIVYLDSVKYNNNMMFYLLGKINNEDSTYTAILPTNSAWIKSYDNISNYFKYYYNPTKPTSVPTKVNADTLQRQNTCISLVRDLVFSKSMQQSEIDSLTSTSLNVFKQPDYLFKDLTAQPASNGKFYICDDLKYRHYESWNKGIKVEAEWSATRASDAYSTLYERYYDGSNAIHVSNSRYIEITPVFPSSKPSVTFDIPGTLSGKLKADKTIEYGASYNVYCVFLPAAIKGIILPAKASFQLQYLDPTSTNPKPVPATGVVTYTFDNKGSDGKAQYFIIDPFIVTKQLVASNVTFPYCEAGLKITNAKLKVISNALALDYRTFTRDLLIDYIILEPVH